MICLRMKKTFKAKTPQGEFKVTIPENLILSKQAVTSKGIPVPYINLQLNPYSNTQLDLFCSDNLSFSMHGSKYVTNQSMHESKYVTEVCFVKGLTNSKWHMFLAWSTYVLTIFPFGNPWQNYNKQMNIWEKSLTTQLILTCWIQ